MDPVSSKYQPKASQELPVTAWSKHIEHWLNLTGQWSSWLWLVLLLTVNVNVAARYLFGQGYVQFEELQWHIYGAGFLLGLSYAMVTDSHIRIDLFHQKYSPRMRAWVELYGLLLLFFPFVCLVIIKSLPFVYFAFISNEISQAPGGLPGRWLIKAMLPIGFALLILAGVARLSRVYNLLFNSPS